MHKKQFQTCMKYLKKKKVLRFQQYPNPTIHEILSINENINTLP